MFRSDQLLWLHTQAKEANMLNLQVAGTMSQYNLARAWKNNWCREQGLSLGQEIDSRIAENAYRVVNGLPPVVRYQVINHNLWCTPGAILEVIDGEVVGGQSHPFNSLTSFTVDDDNYQVFDISDYAYVREIDESEGPVDPTFLRAEFDQLIEQEKKLQEENKSDGDA